MGAYGQHIAYGPTAPPLPAYDPPAYSQPLSGISDTFPLDGDAAVTIRLTGFNISSGAQKHMSLNTGMYSAMPMPPPPPMPVAPAQCAPYSLRNEWGSAQAATNVPSMPPMLVQNDGEYCIGYLARYVAHCNMTGFVASLCYQYPS